MRENIRFLVFWARLTSLKSAKKIDTNIFVKMDTNNENN
jgi:hypothetical protein